MNTNTLKPTAGGESALSISGVHMKGRHKSLWMKCVQRNKAINCVHGEDAPAKVPDSSDVQVQVHTNRYLPPEV